MRKHWFEEYKPVLAMVGLQFIYAASSLSAKEAFSQGVSPMIFIVYRQLTATIVLAPTTILATRRRRGPAALGINGFCLLFFAAFVGLERIEIRSPRSIAKIFGTIICVGGAVLISLFKGPNLMGMVSNDTWKIGCLFLFGSSSCWSLWLILQVPICKNYVDPLSLSSWMCLLSTLQSAVFAFFLEPDLKSWRLNSTFELMCCVYAGVIGSGVAFYLQSWCISRRGPLFSAMFNPLCTVIVTILAILLLHEHLYFWSLVGAAAVVVGLYVVLWGKAEDYDDSTKMPISIDGSSESNETCINESLLDRKQHDDETV